jgi:hypothetical protein
MPENTHEALRLAVWVAPLTLPGGYLAGPPDGIRTRSSEKYRLRITAGIGAFRGLPRTQVAVGSFDLQWK